MKLRQAIEIGEDLLRDIEPGEAPDGYEALKLLIEAGKRLKQIREIRLAGSRALLPDEEPDMGR